MSKLPECGECRCNTAPESPEATTLSKLPECGECRCNTAPMIDVQVIREETRGCEQVVHLNNAGSALPPQPVVDAMVDYLRAEELIGGYEIAAARENELDSFYEATAEYLGCDDDEVAFVPGAGDAWWRAFSTVPLNPGDRILVNRAEYQANAFGWMQARDRGARVDIIPNTASGDVDIDALASMLDDDVKLVSFTMVSMSNGAVQPAAAAGAVLADHPAVFLVDACQAAGQLPLNVEELQCDFLLYTGRKWMRGPRGTGALYARASTMDRLGPPVFIDGRSAVWDSQMTWRPVPSARRFEFGERHFSGQIGLATATRYMLDIGIDTIASRVGELSDQLRRDLSNIDDVTVLDEGTNRCGIVTFTLAGHDLGEVQRELTERRIHLSAPMRTNAQLDIGDRGIAQVLRAGVHYYNTKQELAVLCDALAGLTPG